MTFPYKFELTYDNYDDSKKVRFYPECQGTRNKLNLSEIGVKCGKHVFILSLKSERKISENDLIYRIYSVFSKKNKNYEDIFDIEYYKLALNLHEYDLTNLERNQIIDDLIDSVTQLVNIKSEKINEWKELLQKKIGFVPPVLEIEKKSASVLVLSSIFKEEKEENSLLLLTNTSSESKTQIN